MLAACLGNHRQAVVHYDHALQSSERLGSPTFIALTAVYYGGMLVQTPTITNQRFHGFELLQRALRLSVEHGFVDIATACRQLLANKDERHNRLSSH